MWPLTLREVADAIGVALPDGVDADARVSGATFGERTVTSDDVFFAIRHESIDGHPYLRSALVAGAALAFVAHGRSIDARCVAVEEPLHAYRALAAALRKRLTCPVVAIIGAAGKTTTKEMIACALRNAGLAVGQTPGTDNGWVGIPRTICASAREPLDALVVEVGIDACGAMTHHRDLLSPTVVVVPSLGAEHLEGLENVERAIAEELAIIERPVTVIWNANDPETASRIDGLIALGDIVVREGRSTQEWNEAIALAAARAVGIAAPTLDGFTMPRLRAEERVLETGARVILDSFNANPVSMRAALRDFAEREASQKILVLGDMLDLGDAAKSEHVALARELRAFRGAHVRLVGDAMRHLADELGRDRGGLESVVHVTHDVALDGLPLGEGTLVLAKASRGMRLERLLATKRTQAREPWPPAPLFAKEILTVGVTGTKGKTTTTTLVAAALGNPVISATTLGYFLDGERLDLPLDFDGYIDAMHLGHVRGARHAAIELTSQSLAHGFARAWPCTIGVFTNLSHDHLDVHASPEHYLASKAQLFATLPAGGTAILNARDPASALLEEIIPPGVNVQRYAVGEAVADVVASVLETSWDGTRIACEWRGALAGLPKEIVLRAIGEPFVEDALAAILAAVAAGIPASDAIARVAQTPPPSGRFECVARGPFVVIDYAHAPDALARVVRTARALSKGRTIVVFGAGGDRDREKRPAMGQAVRDADVVILTNDNPRNEDPFMIAEQVRFGLPDHPHLEVELDRARAIQRAIVLAQPADVILIAGKGHERTQTINGDERPFSDAETARAAHATLVRAAVP